MKRVEKFAVIKPRRKRVNSKIAFTECEDQKEQLELCQQVLGTSAKKLSTVFSHVHELPLRVNEPFYE